MSAPAETRALYRALLRVGRAWRAEESRAGRNIREAVDKQVRAVFRANRELSGEAAERALESGVLELHALRLLRTNAFQDRYDFRSNRSLTPQLEEWLGHVDRALSTDAQKDMKKPGLLRRLFGGSRQSS